MPSLWSKSGFIERDNDDDVAVGAKAYFYQGGTTSTLIVYQDAAQGAPWTQPVRADANGRWPQVFIPYITNYDVKVTDAADAELYHYVLIPNPDPAPLTTPTVPASFDPGQVMFEFKDGTKAGWVRCNGRTIGNAASPASERANADCSNLFSYLWGNLPDAQAPVSPSRGASAAADFAANKTITLPDMRGVTLMGLDTMGNAAANAFVGLTFNSGTGATPGSSVGANTIVLTTAQLPAHTHTFSGVTATQSAGHTHTYSGSTSTDPGHSHTASASGVGDHTHSYFNNVNTGTNITAGANQWGVATGNAATTGAAGAHTHTITVDAGGSHAHTYSGTTSDVSGDHTHSFSGTTSSIGGGGTVPNLHKVLLGTWYIKL